MPRSKPIELEWTNADMYRLNDQRADKTLATRLRENLYPPDPPTRKQLTVWGDFIAHDPGVHTTRWLCMRFVDAIFSLDEVVTVNMEVQGGIAVLDGTRYPLSRIVADLADNMTVAEIAEEYDLDEEKIVRLLESTAIILDTPLSHEDIPTGRVRQFKETSTDVQCWTPVRGEEIPG